MSNYSRCPSVSIVFQKKKHFDELLSYREIDPSCLLNRMHRECYQRNLIVCDWRNPVLCMLSTNQCNKYVCHQRQARNQLETLGGAKSFSRGTQIFWLCPIVSNYVQHIFPGGTNKFAGRLRPPWWWVWTKVQSVSPLQLHLPVCNSFHWVVKQYFPSPPYLLDCKLPLNVSRTKWC